MSGFCIDCGHKVESFEGLKACPKCGSTAFPCHDSGQVRVAINWQELRVLVVWAENHGRKIDNPKTVPAIARRLEDQHPDRALSTPLTLAGELRQVKDAYPSTEIQGDDKLAQDVEDHKRINDPPEAEEP